MREILPYLGIKKQNLRGVLQPQDKTKIKNTGVVATPRQKRVPHSRKATRKSGGPVHSTAMDPSRRGGLGARVQKTKHGERATKAVPIGRIVRKISATKITRCDGSDSATPGAKYCSKRKSPLFQSLEPLGPRQTHTLGKVTVRVARKF